MQQRKRGRGDGKNKENIIEDVHDDKDEGSPEPVVEKKKVCYEIRKSEVMGR